ncbi:hypothetical protein L7F22_011522 [Adiantum nelumboides]|nr:hypothetical protein [Adiantum nelumboides]
MGSSSSSNSNSTKACKRKGHQRPHVAWKRSSTLRNFKEGGKSITFLSFDGTFDNVDKDASQLIELTETGISSCGMEGFDAEHHTLAIASFDDKSFVQVTSKSVRVLQFGGPLVSEWLPPADTFGMYAATFPNSPLSITAATLHPEGIVLAVKNKLYSIRVDSEGGYHLLGMRLHYCEVVEELYGVSIFHVQEAVVATPLATHQFHNPVQAVFPLSSCELLVAVYGEGITLMLQNIDEELAYQVERLELEDITEKRRAQENEQSSSINIVSVQEESEITLTRLLPSLEPCANLTLPFTALEYPRLSTFCFSIEELHEEYGLSLEEKLPKELTNKEIPDEEWLSVFKCLHKKSTKLFFNHVRDELVDECRLLYQKVYQATPSNGELLAKFAQGFVYERCIVAVSDPIGHWIAWERFGGSVLENCEMQKGRLEQKINKFCTDYGLTGVIQIEESICDGALSSIPTMSASRLQPFQAVEMSMYIQLVLSMADGLSG